MTSALLGALPTPHAHARILDYCCGSGTIAAALAAGPNGSTLKLHLLDADAVAVDAARANVPSTARVLLSAGWPHTPSAFPKKGNMPPKYDWIVSNPPVHRGQPDDFGVIAELISGARKRLRRSGVLWIVSQEQVPVGRLLALHGTFAWVRATVSADGRFVVWSAGGRAGERGAANAAGEEEAEEAADAEEEEEAEEAAHGQRKAKGKRPDEAKSSRKREHEHASAHYDAGADEDKKARKQERKRQRLAADEPETEQAPSTPPPVPLAGTLKGATAQGGAVTELQAGEALSSRQMKRRQLRQRQAELASAVVSSAVSSAVSSEVSSEVSSAELASASASAALLMAPAVSTGSPEARGGEGVPLEGVPSEGVPSEGRRRNCKRKERDGTKKRKQRRQQVAQRRNGAQDGADSAGPSQTREKDDGGAGAPARRWVTAGNTPIARRFTTNRV